MHGIILFPTLNTVMKTHTFLSFFTCSILEDGGRICPTGRANLFSIYFVLLYVGATLFFFLFLLWARKHVKEVIFGWTNGYWSLIISHMRLPSIKIIHIRRRKSAWTENTPWILNINCFIIKNAYKSIFISILPFTYKGSIMAFLETPTYSLFTWRCHKGSPCL